MRIIMTRHQILRRITRLTATNDKFADRSAST
jgi:hypothetical protein